MSKHQFEQYETGYAVIRLDHFPSGIQVKVVKVVRDPELAQAELDRLSSINADKDCTYELQSTHVYFKGPDQAL